MGGSESTAGGGSSVGARGGGEGAKSVGLVKVEEHFGGGGDGEGELGAEASQRE